MALSTLERLKLVASKFETKADSELNKYIEMATEQVSARVFGDDYQQAVAYMAAHMLEFDDRNGVTGPVTSERAGEVGRSYGFQPTRSALESTMGGGEYLRLLRTKPKTMPLTTSEKFDGSV